MRLHTWQRSPGDPAEGGTANFDSILDCSLPCRILAGDPAEDGAGHQPGPLADDLTDGPEAAETRLAVFEFGLGSDTTPSGLRDRPAS